MKNNISSTLLPLLFLIPVTTQCMKRQNNNELPLTRQKRIKQKDTLLSSEQNLLCSNKKTLKNFQTNREALETELVTHIQKKPILAFKQCDKEQQFLLFTYVYKQQNSRSGRPSNIHEMSHRFFALLFKFHHENHFKSIIGARIKGYSALGVATIEQATSYEDKNIFIQKLRKIGFEPTEQDKEIALIIKMEASEKIVKNIAHLYWIHTDPTKILSQLPKEIIHCISLRIFDTQESLLEYV